METTACTMKRLRILPSTSAFSIRTDKITRWTPKSKLTCKKLCNPPFRTSIDLRLAEPLRRFWRRSIQRMNLEKDFPIMTTLFKEVKWQRRSSSKKQRTWKQTAQRVALSNLRFWAKLELACQRRKKMRNLMQRKSNSLVQARSGRNFTGYMKERRIE